MAVDELETGAGFHAAEDTDESFEESAFMGDALGEIVFALFPLEEAIGGVVGVGEELDVVEESLGLFLGEGEGALEEDTVKAGQGGYNL